MTDLSKDQSEDGQSRKVISLLETAEALANNLQEHQLAFLIERAIDEARNGFVAPRGQEPYRAG